MKRVLIGVVLAVTTATGLAGGSLGCSRNNIEAVNLANEGDKAKSTDIDGAISKYEQATNLDPTNHRILWKLALAYTKKEAVGQGRHDVREGGEARSRRTRSTTSSTVSRWRVRP